MKKLAALLLVLCAAAAVSGCARRPEDVRLASAPAMARWCGREYGAAAVVDSSAGSEVIVYTMRDREKGFTYEARSYVHTIWLDTVWGYSEAKSSDFSEAYRKLFLSEYESDLRELETDVCWFLYDGQEYFVADLVCEDLYKSTRHLGSYPYWRDEK